MPVAETAERMVIRMTMNDVAAMTCDFITPAVAASVLKMDTGRLIEYARKGALPFPVQISGNRVKISRRGFMECYGYAEPEKKKTTAEQLLAEVHQINTALKALGLIVARLLRVLDEEGYGELLDAAETVEGGMKQ